MPSYQNVSTPAYFASVKGTYRDPVPGYQTNNNHNTSATVQASAKTPYTIGRGYPDVAVMGRFYIVVIGSQVTQESGTSASSPVFAAMVSLANSRRIAAGKGPVGFLNPALYSPKASAAGIYNDITNGNNKCGEVSTAFGLQFSSVECCEQGFEASTGWDGASGWGSINFPNFDDYLFSLVISSYQPTPRPTNPTYSPTNKPTKHPSAHPTTRPTPSPTKPTASPVIDASSNGASGVDALSGGAVAGIVISILVVTGLIIGALFYTGVLSTGAASSALAGSSSSGASAMRVADTIPPSSVVNPITAQAELVSR